jgi:hypothetical protein
LRKAFRIFIAVLAASMFLVPRASAGLFSHTPSIERYTGPDAGRLVISLAGYRGANFSRYWLYFRIQDRTKSDSLDYACGGTLSCQGLFGLGSLSAPNTDFVDNIEAGNVLVLPLAPGNYEFYDFEISTTAVSCRAPSVQR